MATYYSYKVTNNGEQEIGVEYMKLWENYDDMCDELDKWVGGLTGKDVKPDRSKIPCLYPCASMMYHKEDGCEAHITRMLVVPKPKKYVYQYWVENKICGLHTKSGKYTSFDDACDALDRELRELHENPDWKPRMTREEFKDYMGDYWASTYDFYNTDTYILSRREV
jgi:hypothetical protein